MRIEDLDDLGEVGERAGQPVDLVDHDDVDLARLDIGQQPLQSRALHGAAGDSRHRRIVAGSASPALVPLARDVGLAGLALGIEGVELLLQPLLGRFAGVDGAAQAQRAAARPCGRSCCLRRALVMRRPPLSAEPLPDVTMPKKRGPDQCAPVMCFGDLGQGTVSDTLMVEARLSDRDHIGSCHAIPAPIGCQA